jgi:hypothetical protein
MRSIHYRRSVKKIFELPAAIKDRIVIDDRIWFGHYKIGHPL